MARLIYLLIAIVLAAFHFWALAKIVEIYSGDHEAKLAVIYTGFFWVPVLMCTIATNVMFLAAVFFPASDMSHEEAEEWADSKMRKFKKLRYAKIIWNILDEIF